MSLITSVNQYLISGGWERRLWFCALVLAALSPWPGYFPAMTDLPQHAGQLGLARDLLLGQSAWAEQFNTNAFTPYLLMYALGVPLSLVLPTTWVIKLLLSLACVAFALSGRWLRREMGADPRLDWLLFPSFFGFAWKWGFLSFLLAAPVGIAFVAVALRYARSPTPRAGLWVLGTGLLLFFSHGLVFGLCMLVGVLFLLLPWPGFGRVLRTGWPYAVLFTGAIVFVVLRSITESDVTALSGTQWSDLLHRAVRFFGYYPLGSEEDPWFAVLMLGMFAAPWLMGCRSNTDPRAWAPIAVVVGIFLLAPDFTLTTTHVYQRFALFVLPFYVLIFRSPELVGQHAQSNAIRFRTAAGRALLIICCIVFVSVQWQRSLAFADESRSFVRLIKAVPPGQRMLVLTFNRYSPAANNYHAYLHFGALYQAERQGLVDMNFGWFMAMLLRYAPEHRPAVGPGFEWNPGQFDWGGLEAWRYRYFLVRSKEPLPADFFDNPRCPVQLSVTDDQWALYTRGQCRPEASAAQ